MGAGRGIGVEENQMKQKLSQEEANREQLLDVMLSGMDKNQAGQLLQNTLEKLE